MHRMPPASCLISKWSGCVYDFEAANKYKRELDSIVLDTQDKAREWLYEKLYHLDEAFRMQVNLYKVRFAPHPTAVMELICLSLTCQYHSPINCEPLPIERYKEVPALLPYLEAAEAAAPPLRVIKYASYLLFS